MKSTIILFLSLFSTTAFCQTDSLPMKGNYVYYEFNEKTSNTKHCIAYYSTATDSTGAPNRSAVQFGANVSKKTLNLNKNQLSLTGLKNTTIMFTVPVGTSRKCKGEMNGAGSIMMTLPTGGSLLEYNFLYSLFTIGKFKVSSQVISATVNIKFISDNEYTLVFTNFVITYAGHKGGEFVQEVLNIEDIYKSLQTDGKQDGKMYDKAMESITDLDTIVKALAKIYSEELKRTYELDEL